ncbi:MULTISPECIES: hypothetical protein [unclassified Brevibacterium]|uniref:hypothetical protein n=1 Tax=unclassified Brevibacterium TaxID=2614124 RepID=UPI0010930CF1|nr:hypothetical protein [Brevibacterium sp. S22]
MNFADRRPVPVVTPAENEGLVDGDWGKAVGRTEGQADFWHRIDVSGVPFPLWVRVAQSEHGDFVITGMLLGDPEGAQAIGTGGLSKIAINDILSAIDDAHRSGVGNFREYSPEFSGRVPRPGGQVLGDDTIYEAATVATLVKWYGKGRPVISTTAEALNVSRATASRRIQRARDLGLLDKAAEVLGAADGAANAKMAEEYGIVEYAVHLEDIGEDGGNA